MFIAIDGIDGCGKDTQVELLAGKIHPLLIVQCPNRKTRTGKIISAFLNRRVEIPRMAEIALFEANRWEWASQVRQTIAEGETVIANRWYHSGLAYAVPSGKKYASAVEALDAGLPDPDISFILDITAEEAARRKHRKDKFESDTGYLNEVRRAFLGLAERHHWTLIDGMQDRRTVHDAILRRLHSR